MLSEFETVAVAGRGLRPALAQQPRDRTRDRRRLRRGSPFPKALRRYRRAHQRRRSIARWARGTAASCGRRSPAARPVPRRASARASRRGRGACRQAGSEFASATTSSSRNGKRPSTEWAMSIRSPCEDSRYPDSSVWISRYWSCARELHCANSGGRRAINSETAFRLADSARMSPENSRLMALVVRQRGSCAKPGAWRALTDCARKTAAPSPAAAPASG